MSKTAEYKKIIIPLIHARLSNAKIILYGSRARKDDQPGSDIDIALDAGDKIDESIMTQLYFDLEESSLPIKFDIVDYRALSDRMQKEILKDGVIWKE